MERRGTIQIPLDHIVDFNEDLRKGVLEIVLEGESYPRWNPGTDPMIFLGLYQLRNPEFIRALVYYNSNGEWPNGASKEDDEEGESVINPD